MNNDIIKLYLNKTVKAWTNDGAQTYEPGHSISYKTQISLCRCTGWAESSLFTWRCFESLATHRVPRKDWSDCTHAQAAPNLCWAHMYSWRKCCGPAHIMSDWTQCKYAFLKSNNEYTPTLIFKMRSVALNWHLVILTGHMTLQANSLHCQQKAAICTISNYWSNLYKIFTKCHWFSSFFVSNTPYLGSIFPFSLNFRY